MTPYTPEEIEQRFTRLPEPLKDEMMSVENSERIFEVGKKFALTIEQIGFLAEESGYVVLGLTHPNNFVARLKDHLRVDEEKAKTIAQEINHQVFFPLREMLKNTHQFELTQGQIQASPPPIPSIPRVQPIVPSTPPIPMPRLPVVPIQTLPPIPKTITPIPPPKPTALSSVHPPLPPIIIRQAPGPFTHTDLPVIEEKKLNQSAALILQNKPIIPPTPRSIEGIKPKESVTPAPAALPQSILPEHKPGMGLPQQNIDIATQGPLPPSQIMQKKLLNEAGRIKTPILRPEVERIKESLFAPPSAPAQSKPIDQSMPPPTQPPAPDPAPLQKPPTSYSTHDPYREPIE